MKPGVWGVALLAVGSLGPAVASERLSNRTLAVAVEIDRDGARLLGFTVKPRPFDRGGLDTSTAPIEVGLLGPGGAKVTRRVQLSGLCLAHPPDDPPHIVGDTIELHRESFVVEVPELPGFDRLEIAYAVPDPGKSLRRVVSQAPLTQALFDPAGGRLGVADLALTLPAGDPSQRATLTSGTVLWPEQFGETPIYDLNGDASQVDSRINVVIVPDGYTHDERTLMEDHARALVNYFRNKTPYKEHDLFMNYTLVYAYSLESGTDQCDCGVIKDTAMASRFPNDGYPCGNSGNRCLYYGGGCDTNSSFNITAAELRAPAADATILMVNTTRYGGCGGARAVYSAGNGAATEIAGHELGHSLGNLADEYGGAGCGTSAGELNTSTNGVTGAWPEWIGDIGAPKPGGQYYDSCIYRPENSCEMRTLGPPFCRVCNQQWGLTFFGHFRVSGTAPIASAEPVSPLAADIGFAVPFSVATRLPSGAGVTHSIVWQKQAPSDRIPVTVATGVTDFSFTFPAPGAYTLTCSITADTNFIKKEKYGPNVDLATWHVQAAPFPVPSEVSPLVFTASDSLSWAPASQSGSSAFNLYRGAVAALSSGDHGSCLTQELPTSSGVDTDIPPAGVAWFYLVTGVTSSGEGTMGNDSAGTLRVNAAPCAGP